MIKDHCTPEIPANNGSSSSRASYYAIRIKGLLDPHWDWLENLAVSYIETGETLLRGPILDQAALHGLLVRLRDLNLTLLSVNPIDPEDHRKGD